MTNTQAELLSQIKNEVARLKKVESDNDWEYVRDGKNYKLVEFVFPFGRRFAYEPLDQQTYRDLQASRGLSFTDDIESNIERIRIDAKSLDGEHLSRMLELEQLTREDAIYLPVDCTVTELGFRQPSILHNFIQMGKKAVGYDVVDVNVLVGQYLGYDARKYDLNDCSEDLDLSNSFLVCSYHSLEHLTCPMYTIEKIYKSMERGAYVHVEVPIEPCVPQIRHGHLYAFSPDDLHMMLKLAGFTVIYSMKSELSFGRKIERYLAIK